MDMDQAVDTRNLPKFKALFIFSQLVGMVAIILTTVWSGKFFGGFGFEDAVSEFNFHPPFMVAVVFLCGNGIIIYRGFRFKPKPLLKWIHTVFHWISLLACTFSLFTVIDFHNRKNFANFYSLHSWVGIFVSAAYFGQFIISFFLYMMPCFPDRFRKAFMSAHIFGGLFILALMIVSCLTGFTEKMLFRNLKDWSSREPIGLYVNWISVLLLLYGALVAWMVYITEYKRRPSPADEKAANNNYRQNNTTMDQNF